MVLEPLCRAALLSYLLGCSKIGKIDGVGNVVEQSIGNLICIMKKQPSNWVASSNNRYDFKL